MGAGGSAGVKGGAGREQVVVAAAIGLIIDKLRIGSEAGHGADSVLQFPVAWSVLIHQVVEVLIVWTGIAVLLDAVTVAAGLESVAVNDVVAHQGVVVDHRGGEAARVVAIAHQDATVGVVEHGVVGDRDLGGGMPEMNPPSLTAIHQVVPDVAPQVGVIDTVLQRIGLGEIADVMHHVADHIIVVSGAVLMVDDPAAVD